MTKKILVTGGTGFIGQYLCDALVKLPNVILKTAIRKKSKKIYNAQNVLISNIDGNTLWNDALEDVQVVIHLAARAHVKFEQGQTSLEKFRNVNTDGTIRLAEQAAAKGVTRFIFLSSIGVNGVKTNLPFLDTDKPNPTEDYAVSKLDAEHGLKAISEKTGMEVVIIRPPLVYGKNAPGNFATLLKLARINIPLPLGAIKNKRSFVAVTNLVDLILTCVEHSSAANEIFLVSDGSDISTTEFLRLIRISIGSKAMLLPIPMGLIVFLASILGKKKEALKISDSLQVDIQHTQKRLGWKPLLTTDQALLDMLQQKE
jgi:nucleoside-diphosphate-sugar epimerase